MQFPSFVRLPSAHALRQFGRKSAAFLTSLVLVAGSFAAPTPVFAATEGPNSPDVGNEYAFSGGTINWSSENDIFSSNNNRAQATLNTSSITEYLRATDFDFALPSGAVINGIQVGIERQASEDSDLRDYEVRLVTGLTGSAATSTNYAKTTSGDAWQEDADEIETYGGVADLWGVAWTEAQIESSTFGVILAVRNHETSGPSETAEVDHVTVTVTYTAGDTTAPTVTNVTSSTTNGSYNAGDSVFVQVTFSETVFVTGGPRILLETGATDRNATYTSGSGTATLNFIYTVQAGDTSGDLDYTSTSALSLNGGTIRDAASNNATLTLAAPAASGSLGANKTIVIDTTVPTLAQVTPVPTPTNDNTPDYSFSASEAGTISYGGACSSAVSSAVNGTQTVTFNALTDGLKSTCTITVTDLAGNASTPLAVSPFTVDTDGPSATVSSTGSNPTNAATIPFQVVFGESVTGFTDLDLVVTNGVAGAVSGSGTTYTFSVTPSAEGTVMVSVPAASANDAAGNGNDLSNTASVSYDITAPGITVTSGPHLSGYSLSSTAVFGYTVSGGATSVSCSIDGGAFGPCDSFSSHTLTGLIDGAHAFAISAEDAATNVFTVTPSLPFTVDTVLPVPTFSASAVMGGYASTSPITVALGFSESVTGLLDTEILAGNGAVSALAGSGMSYAFTLTPSAEGTVTLDLPAGSASDAAGNGNAAATQFSFVYDITAPGLVIDSGPADGGYGSSTPTTFAFTATDANPVTTLCSFDGAAFTSCTGSASEALVDGLHSFSVKATDAAGNSTTVSRTFTVDTVLPTVTEVAAVDAVTSDQTPSFTVDASEAGTYTFGGSCAMGSTAAALGNSTLTFDTLAVGLHDDCTVTLTDLAGNPSLPLLLTGFTIVDPSVGPTTPTTSGGGGGAISLQSTTNPNGGPNTPPANPGPVETGTGGDGGQATLATGGTTGGDAGGAPAGGGTGGTGGGAIAAAAPADTGATDGGVADAGAPEGSDLTAAALNAPGVGQLLANAFSAVSGNPWYLLLFLAILAALGYGAWRLWKKFGKKA